jgi:hypothetical protein
LDLTIPAKVYQEQKGSDSIAFAFVAPGRFFGGQLFVCDQNEALQRVRNGECGKILRVGSERLAKIKPRRLKPAPQEDLVALNAISLRVSLLGVKPFQFTRCA